MTTSPNDSDNVLTHKISMRYVAMAGGKIGIGVVHYPSGKEVVAVDTSLTGQGQEGFLQVLETARFYPAPLPEHVAEARAALKKRGLSPTQAIGLVQRSH